MVRKRIPERHDAKMGESRRIITALKAKADAKRSFSEQVADTLTHVFGSMGFLLLNVLWFALWIVVNLSFIPGIRPFDPFPFGLLTMIVSLEAIILAIIVLISQNRATKVYDVREEVDLQVDIITEEEITKLMRMVALLMQKQGVEVEYDKTLQTMLQPIKTEKLEKTLEAQV